MNSEVFEALSSIDGFSGLDSETTVITRLGGLTNRNYKIDCERGSYVLRLAGEGTGDYIDREAEFYNTSIASRAVCDLLWTLWGVVQHANGNPVDDFWAYAGGRLDRCRLLMASDDFPKQLEAVHRGRG